jgi:hypothetical protein
LLPPIPAPRSSSLNRKLVNNENENSDDQERPRRRSKDVSPRRNPSPVPRSVSSNFDELEQMNSTEEQASMRPLPGKKKKVIGAGRQRLQGDSLPPLAPSSAASRRDDFPQTKGPPVGTPRPQPIVAQWAITSPSPHSTAEKLTTISSDNELDNDEDKYKSLKPIKRIVSPHPITTNRIINNKNNPLTIDNNGDYQKLSRQKRRDYLNDDDDDNNTLQRSSSTQKSRSKLSDDDEVDDTQKKTNSKAQDRYSRQRYDRNNDDDDDDVNNVPSRRVPSSTRKSSSGDSSHRFHSKTNGNTDDDDLR